MRETGRSGLVHWADPEGWDGKGGGRGIRMGTHVHSWLIHVNVWQKPLLDCKVISLQLKYIKFFFNRKNIGREGDWVVDRFKRLMAGMKRS